MATSFRRSAVSFIYPALHYPAYKNPSPCGSLHRHALGQVARFVHVGATGQGGVVRQKLQWHHVQDGRQRAVVLRHTDNVQALGAFDAGVGIGQHVEHATARAHFLHIAFELFQQRIVGRHGHHRHGTGHQR